MAGARQPQRRPALSTLTPQPKPVISVEDWEVLAPLSDIGLRSVTAVKNASAKTPLPLKFSAEDESPSRASTPIPALRGKPGGSGSRPGTPALGAGARGQGAHALHPKQPIQTPQQFYDWFALIDRTVAHSQEAHFRAHLADVSDRLETCDRLVEHIDAVERDVEGMLEEWRSVEEGGKNLKDASEKLLEEKDRLTDLTGEIGMRLEYFQELEHATRMLNHPGESLVLQTDFLYMVERVDICIDYLRAHRHFREAEVYLLRFQQCMTRAMTLIKMFFVGSLRALTTDVSKRLSERDVSATAQMHLLYTRFKSVSAQLSPLLAELERRAASHPAELSALLAECHSAYFAARKALLVGRLTEEIRGLDPARTELVELTRSGCSYLKQLCTDEFNLYRAFFNSGEEQLYQYLENLCDYLYDDLRPRILHEQRLAALCDVCVVLQALMVLDVAAPSFSARGAQDGSDASSTGEETETETETDADDDEARRADELALDLDGPRRRGLGLRRLHTGQLLQMVLQDAQTRLFFKAQAVIQSEIRYYVPQPQDLAYPDKLVAARNPPPGTPIREKESGSMLFALPAREKEGTWYPTLQKTVWVLSQLHDFVKPAIFEDIAQEAVNLCRQSLRAAAELIKPRSPPTSALDGVLFLVRHLLILKEMTHNVDLAHRNAEPSGAAVPGGSDYAVVTDALSSVFTRTSSLLPDGLFASLGLPRSDESIVDAKLGIDQDLKHSCEDVIALCADGVSLPLRQWVDRVRVHNAARAPGVAPPTAEPAWAAQPAAETLEREFRAACARDLRAAVGRLALYLEDERTVSVLLTHIRERVVDDYVAFADVVGRRYGGKMRGQVMEEGELHVMLKRICEDTGV